ncbi:MULTISPECIES: type II secretion system secretin GspD [unclassified Hyphomonas]|jgi:general secretion pathway protein D|uniref:type II secretion system secretin GspD n=4 Tax=Hyphomonas TaxID=85 RepID=UPI000C8F9C7C|nr:MULTISPECIES: type II secretion system secretin GspD [unclassified Hyphomonas]MAL46412.1 type II secretion system protein GspD [Hyphomonas sp.]QSR22932.1 type II secretion system protein GspD [Hyphomonas sp. KY3]RCL87183.1 MAG: type II secretion system protein GspD [Hyphomonas sp.]HAW54254.1 type II secretion system protein GspD [Hyphomonas sp.]HBJ42515.1 type II secretion system protein GspD [Hyphomonas sp.]|tara:strand:- start:11553 stop:13505 length:1953 start_codon:yes stop_codon:yes gene_type:complete
MNLKTLLSATAVLAASPSAFALANETPADTARHILNFEDVELSALIADVSTVTGYTFVVHPEARTKRITVSSTTPLTRQQVFDVFLSSLRVHGFTAIPAGKATYRIVPEQSAVGEAGMGAYGSNAFTTEIFSLQHLNALEAAKMLKPVIDEQGQVIANAQSNTLVVVDYASNIPRLRSMVDKIDADPSVTETIQLANTSATEVANILTSLNTSAGEDAYKSNFRAIASEAGNALILRGDPAAVERAKLVTADLDGRDRLQDTIRVVPLNNADAADVVPILQQVAFAIDKRRGLADASEATTIAHHDSTNSLVISAAPETLLSLERVIGDLDRRRAQVLVEAIIVEMADDTARQLGLQFLLSGTGSSSVPFATTNFSASAPNLLTLAGAISSDTPFSGDEDSAVSDSLTTAALNSLLGLTGITVGVGGQDGDTLFGAVLTAVEADTNSRILSKPFNMTLDNGTSSLLVGQNVPITTGQVLGDDNTNAFTTVDRKDVGVGLTVTPRVSNDGTIRMQITQTVSNVAGAITAGVTDIVLNTREINTSVIADDGEIIVLGGLIEQTEAFSNEKVPLLGDIPVAGRLFRTEGKSLGRTNLMVFIRPTIVRDRAGAKAVTSRSYNYIRAEELWDGEGSDTSSIDNFITEVLGSPPPQ